MVVRLDIGVGHVAEGRDGRGRRRLGGTRVDLLGHVGDKQLVLVARAFQRPLGQRSNRRLVLLTAEPVAIDEIRFPLADHAKVETSAVGMAAGFFDQALERGLCELWHERPQCPCFNRGRRGFFGHMRARRDTAMSRII